MKVPQDFAIATALFSPTPHPRRTENFQAFRRQFSNDLHVAEARFGDDAQLPRGSTTIEIRAQALHLMWQKERLLNFVISGLPEKCRYVAWLDADILFRNPTWVEEAKRLLDEHPVIQLFDTVVHLRPDGLPGRQTAGAIAAFGVAPSDLPVERLGATGFAWAARRDYLSSIGGLMDFMVIGGADACMAEAFLQRRYVGPTAAFPQALRSAVDSWSKRAREAMSACVGYLPGTIEHLYHGKLTTRRYLQRYRMLSDAAFDPAADIARDGNGLYKWSSRKPDLHRQVREYFSTRSAEENE